MNNLVFKSITTKKLKKEEILSICKLKNTYWKYGVKSQLKWFKDNIKKNDFHNLVYLKKKLIGYNLLRKRTFLLKKQKKSYLYFDTLIVLEKYRKIKIGHQLCNFIVGIIKKSKLHSMLICEKKSVGFYAKYRWMEILKTKFEISDHKYSKNYLGMFINQKKILSKNKIKYFIFC
jgi:hypothetical protein|tara:strand:+ start:119 stop:643 length:525 start_codon:yes stop_codon:yes gene_type:complete